MKPYGLGNRYHNKLTSVPIFSVLFLIFLPFYAHAAELGYQQVEKKLQQLNRQLQQQPDNALAYAERGDLYFKLRDFENAIEDYDAAIKLDPMLDQAWFGRGMANGRMGYIDEGIADLSVYIKRNPDSTRAYTKRGVRYLWKGDSENASSDFNNALKLDPNNAEAHDDLGVIKAQKGDYTAAIEHFTKTITIDPSYQKGHHNLAMAYYLTEQDLLALQAVNNSLQLAPEARDSVLLKSEILKSLGRVAEAKALEDEAMFLPEGNWSEHAPVK